METKNIEELKKIQKEMRESFEQWDERIQAKQQPVAIQDLDYWIVVLNRVLDIGINGLKA